MSDTKHDMIHGDLKINNMHRSIMNMNKIIYGHNFNKHYTSPKSPSKSFKISYRGKGLIKIDTFVLVEILSH